MTADVARHDNPDWVTFWMRDVEAVRLPRWVVRIDLAILQTASRYSNGTPGDNQIGPQLLDADVFVTADKPFAAVLRRLGSTTSLAPFPAIEQCASGDEGVNQLINIIPTLPPLQRHEPGDTR